MIGAQPRIANTKYIQFCAMYAQTALSIIPFAPMPNIALMYKKAFPMPVERKITQKSRLWQVVYTAGIVVCLIVSVSFICNNAYNPFIYFNF